MLRTITTALHHCQQIIYCSQTWKQKSKKNEVENQSFYGDRSIEIKNTLQDRKQEYTCNWCIYVTLKPTSNASSRLKSVIQLKCFMVNIERK